jgi:hypothetical protein
MKIIKSNSKKYAPIIIFAFNRPDHTFKLLQSLILCKNFKEFKIFIFLDGSKVGDNKNKKKVLEVKNILLNFKNTINNNNIKIFCSKKNVGLYKNLTTGITKVFKKYSKAIVLEDDLIVNKNFIHFMNKSLIKYKNNKKILQISGYSYPINYKKKEAYFLNLTSCWGWATWRDRWIEFMKFSRNKALIKKDYINIYFDKNKKNEFNIFNSYNYLKMLKKQIAGNFNSWGILFYLFSFKNKSLNLFPPFSFIENKGFDGSGMHGSTSNIFNLKNKKTAQRAFYYPKKIQFNVYLQKKIGIFLLNELNIISKIVNRFFR